MHGALFQNFRFPGPLLQNEQLRRSNLPEALVPGDWIVPLDCASRRLDLNVLPSGLLIDVLQAMHFSA
jgi:hypothetical protein